MAAETVAAIRRLVDVAFVAIYLGMSQRRVWSLIAAGLLQRIKVGRSVRIDMRDLERFIESCKRRDPFASLGRPERPPPKRRRPPAPGPKQGTGGAERPNEANTSHDTAPKLRIALQRHHAVPGAPNGCDVQSTEGER